MAGGKLDIIEEAPTALPKLDIIEEGPDLTQGSVLLKPPMDESGQVAPGGISDIISDMLVGSGGAAGSSATKLLDPLTGYLPPQARIPAKLGLRALGALGGGFGIEKLNEILGMRNEAPSALSTGINSLLGGTFKGAMASRATDIEDPLIAKGLEIADGSTLPKPLSKINSVGSGTKLALENVDKQAANLAETIAQRLEIGAGKSAQERALSEEFDNSFDAILKTGILNNPQPNMKALAEVAGKKADEILSSRNYYAAQLDKNATENGIAKISYADIANGFDDSGIAKTLMNLENAPQTAGPLLSTSKDTIKRVLGDVYRKSSGISKEDKDALEAFVNRFGEGEVPTSAAKLAKIKEGEGLSLAEALDLNKALNFVRRSLFKEFDNPAVARVAVGGNPLTNPADQLSVDIIAGIQSSLKDTIDRKTDEIVKAAGFDSVPANILTDLNSQYGGLKVLAEAAGKFGNSTREQLVALRRQIPVEQYMNPSQMVTASTKASGARALLSAIPGRDVPSELAQREAALLGREPKTLGDISRFIDINKAGGLGPIQKAPGILGEMGQILGSGLGVGTANAAINNLPQAQQPIPRDASALWDSAALSSEAIPLELHQNQEFQTLLETGRRVPPELRQKAVSEFLKNNPDLAEQYFEPSPIPGFNILKGDDGEYHLYDENEQKVLAQRYDREYANDLLTLAKKKNALNKGIVLLSRSQMPKPKVEDSSLNVDTVQSSPDGGGDVTRQSYDY